MNISTTPLPFNYIDRSWERVCRKKTISAANPNKDNILQMNPMN
jgi:hypothetical protein